MARVVNAQYSTLVGTPKQLRELIDIMAGKRAAVVSLEYSNFIVLGKPVTAAQLATALQTTPRKQR